MNELAVRNIIQEIRSRLHPAKISDGMEFLIVNGLMYIDDEGNDNASSEDKKRIWTMMKGKETPSMQFSISDNEFQIMVATEDNFFRIKVKKSDIDDFETT